ncbi:MAG: nuclear transport factor 2 family protein [Rhodocyclaceae bacterium]|jgi:hypothetical protein|nr:nuclear transport factor 2 family protein [Rhodocyclaceae bacterium]
MLSLQEISDRLELQQLVVDYASAIDSRQFDHLDQVFTPDACIDYRVFGGPDGPYPEIKAWLQQALSPLPAYQHLVGNQDFRITGDQASGRVMCLNPMSFPRPEGGVQVAFFGLWYLDEYVRTPAGWRIASRREEKAFDYNSPLAAQ